MGRIPIGEQRESKASLNQLQNGGVIRHRVIHEVLLRVRRNDNQRNSISRISAVAGRTRGRGADVPRAQIHWKEEIVGCDRPLGRYVIVEPAGFVIGQDED